MNQDAITVSMPRRDHMVVALCDRFELDWRSGQSPRIEDYLSALEVDARGAAFGELLRVELVLRRARGDAPSSDEYRQRFPDQAHEIETVFRSSDARNADTADHDGSTTGGGLQVCCPSCHAAVGVAADSDLATVHCPECGSKFSLIGDGTNSQQRLPLTSLGRFDLLERLGMGAFGSVWKARDKQLDRMVAIKIPRATGMTAEDQEKFFREARAAAQLRHPNIVSVHEVGRDGDSLYIVSDFVRGVTLGDWLSGQRPTSRDAALLCAQITEALEHAHEQGVVHRDLKPANIMIDSAGQPHIMDFGLARRDAGEVSVTLEGHILGTPAYMSPEQAQGHSHAADRRSDVYSMGVILFQLLTGELPFRGNFRMLMHQVIHDEPPGPRKLNSNVSKDLETITLKCLEKEPARRYQSSRELAAELRRVLAGEPIHARPIGRPERTLRWVRRNRVVSALAATAAFGLVGGTVASTLFAIDARRQAAAAVAKETETAAVLDFVENKVFAAARPEGQEGGLGPDVSIQQAIDASVPFVASRFTAQPLIEARLRRTLGRSYWFLGKPTTAAEQLELARTLYVQELGTTNPETLRMAMQLATCYLEMDRFAEALKLHEATLTLRKEQLGPEHPDTLLSMVSLANCYDAIGRNSEALELRESVLAIQQRVIGFDHADTLVSMMNLANSFFDLGRYEDALKLHEATLELRKSKLGVDHPQTLQSMINVANCQQYLGRHEDSLKLREFTLALQKTKLGLDHPDTLLSMHNVGVSYSYLDQTEKAIEFYEEALERQKVALGPKHVETLTTMNNLAKSYFDLGRHEEAINLSTETIAIQRSKLGPNHLDVLSGMRNLAVMYHELGREAEAVARYKEVLDLLQESELPADHWQILACMNSLAWMFATSEHENVRDGKSGVALATKACELSSYQDHMILDTLAAACAETGDFESAIKWCEKAIELVEDRDPDTRREYQEELAVFKSGKSIRQAYAEAVENESDSAKGQPEKADRPDRAE